jgi:hypothetical protein
VLEQKTLSIWLLLEVVEVRSAAEVAAVVQEV